MIHNEVFSFLEGKTAKVEGFRGIFSVDPSIPSWRGWTEERLIFTPNKGQRKYKKQKAELGDDWIIDMTGDIEGYCQIAIELGYKPEE